MNSFRFLPALLQPVVLMGLLAAAPATAGEHVLVMGDSLTKEYQSEFAVLYPDHPEAWQARNWIEILDARRNGQFDLGSWELYLDWRLTGHEYNWARPGGTAREFRNFLRQDAAAQTEIKASSGGEVAWPLFPSWRSTFAGLTGGAARVIIFYGGNDLALGNSDPVANPVVDGSPKQIDYETIYAGTFGEASNPDNLRTSIRSNLKSIIQWFRDPRPDGQPPRFSGPMMLCAVPHVGCTPKVQQDAGTDPVRTAVLTRMIETLNVELRDFAASKDVGFADIYPVTKQILDPGLFQIGGITFLKEADDDCRPRYLFSGDGFHPNTAAHARIAQVVADAFLTKYPEMAADLPRLSDREIITGVLGLPAATGYLEWLAAAAVPAGQQGPLADPDKDGMANAMEYALADRRPEAADPDGPFSMVRRPDPGGSGEVLVITWRPRFAENAYCDLTPQLSPDLNTWSPVEAGMVATGADGSRAVTLPVQPGERRYFRLVAVTGF